MAGIPVAGADAGAGLEPLAIFGGDAVLQHFLRVFHGVERLNRRLGAARTLLALALGLALLNAGSVGQEIFEQAIGGLGGDDGLAVTLVGELGQEPGMIDMGVRQ